MRDLTGLKTLFLISICGLFLVGCSSIPKQIEPKVAAALQSRYIEQLPAPFSPLTPSERATDWGKEITIGRSFGKKLDLYQAITSLRRAEILLPPDQVDRKREVHYEILLSYYLAGRFADVDETFQQSDLSQVGPDFTPFHDLLVILYDTYEHLDSQTKASAILELVRLHFRGAYDELVLSSAVQRADFITLATLSTTHPDLKQLIETYDQNKKSQLAAPLLNAFIPGAGYLYLGQTQTAVTAFLVNGLFIASSVYFFIKGPLAAAIIMTGFEAGWYFGGIYGGIAQAKIYNERVYEKTMTPLMIKERLFPVYQLQYGY